MIIAVLLLCSTTAFAQIKSASLTASGLTCSMCSKSIFKSLSKVSFIKNVDVNVETSTFTLQFNDGANVVPDVIKKAVEDAGFSVASLQFTMSFDKTEVYNDAHVKIGANTFHFMNVDRKTLNGDNTVTVIDKNYVPAKSYKKYSKYTKMKCFETGYMASCCPKEPLTTNRVYHVTL